jgi:hypothetical protein
MKAIVRPFMPRPADAPPESDYPEPGVLEEIATRAGLDPESAFDSTWAYEFPDEDTVRRALVAPAGIAVLVGPDCEDEVKDAILQLHPDLVDEVEPELAPTRRRRPRHAPRRHRGKTAAR